MPLTCLPHTIHQYEPYVLAVRNMLPKYDERFRGTLGRVCVPITPSAIINVVPQGTTATSFLTCGRWPSWDFLFMFTQR